MPGAMLTQFQIWPFAVDRSGLWLCCGGEPWTDGQPITTDLSPRDEVLLELSRRGAGDLIKVAATAVMYFMEGGGWLNFYAALNCPGPVLESWPEAWQVTPETIALAAPEPAAAYGVAQPRPVDTMHEALRDLDWRLVNDATTQYQFADHPAWGIHLDGLRDALGHPRNLPFLRDDE